MVLQNFSFFNKRVQEKQSAENYTKPWKFLSSIEYNSDGNEIAVVHYCEMIAWYKKTLTQTWYNSRLATFLVAAQASLSSTAKGTTVYYRELDTTTSHWHTSLGDCRDRGGSEEHCSLTSSSSSDTASRRHPGHRFHTKQTRRLVLSHHTPARILGRA